MKIYFFINNDVVWRTEENKIKKYVNDNYETIMEKIHQELSRADVSVNEDNVFNFLREIQDEQEFRM
jgi:hypothetical protein